MRWRREPEIRYGGEPPMAKEQRLYNEEQYAKRAFAKLSLWKKFKHHASEIAFKIWTIVVLYLWFSTVTIPITAAIIFFVLWIRK